MHIEERLARVKRNAVNGKITKQMIDDFVSTIRKICNGYMKEYDDAYTYARNSEIYRWVIEDPIL